MKNIIITGAGTGLGRSLAIQYGKKGDHVFLVGRRIEPLETVKEEIAICGGSATAIACDITNTKDIQNSLHSFLETDRIDLLINNAGTGCFGPLDTYSDDEIEQVLATNIKGTINMTRAILPLLVEQGEGQLMNVISTAGLRGKKNESVYVASKFAVRGFTESLIKELEGTAIQVTAVYMGGMDTPFWDETDHIKDRSRLKSPDTVAELIVDQNAGQAEIFIDR
ncbi:SDR family oxidoreductase [Alkalihalobacillus sp. AL-G]|uniref:SDR family NAD(P)-dependent oxidoreductase n=1 Tax=Alkalihalobacillus sp. AL-G TaxID=2926399 RepID=UPI00272A9A71|nr:SDR family NAD(P)-dependent oxidoreductase [Alkalihalobacillus sp. AL-G]WLD93971.1 SDR family NAD(P)-dependent oxidoreductase [Alkalihalobacillus sp. AL-G]